MAVAQLYYYVAPRSEVHVVAKSLIRLLRHHRYIFFRLQTSIMLINYSREIQVIVLKSIASIADKHKDIFEPHLKSFYVHSTDTGLVKRYKLEILTTLANGTTIATILREFQVCLYYCSILLIIRMFIVD
jgi:AP-3 complex subunit beta